MSTIKKLSSTKRSLTFADCSPEIIGYRDYINEEEEDEFERSLLALKLDSTGVDDLSVDDETDCELLALKKLTEANTLFNSNYANFKTELNGVLGKPKSESTGVVKFQIQDGYNKPLAPTRISNTRKLFEQNNKLTNDTRSCTVKSESNKMSKTSIEPKKVINNIGNGECLKVSDKVNDKLDATHKSSNKFSIEKIDFDTIRIPRASIQLEKSKTSPTDELDCSFAIKSKSENISDRDNHPVVARSTESSPVIMVDSVEGSILTLDSNKLPQLDDSNTDNVLYMLPTVEMKNPDDNNENLDSLSETSSGCCSVNSSQSPSPIHTETCSSPNPDSLDSTPDSYDLVKSDDSDDMNEMSHDLIVSNPERNTICLSKCDDVEKIESLHEIGRSQLMFLYFFHFSNKFSMKILVMKIPNQIPTFQRVNLLTVCQIMSPI